MSNGFPVADRWFERRAVDDAVDCQADAVILADVGVMEYCAKTHPQQRLHVSVQAAAANPDSIRFYVDAFNAKRVVLPRVLSVQEISAITKEVNCETEVFIFGGLCVMEEGRCSLSSYATGLSPNRQGVCSPASHVRYERRGDQLVSRLGDFTINIFEEDEPAGYPTLCKGRFIVGEGEGDYLFEEPTSLNAVALMPELKKAGVKALKIEGRTRSEHYVAAVIDVYRDAEDAEYDDVDLDEFADEIDGWIIDALKNIGCDSARSVLNLSVEELVRRTDLEEETVVEVLDILRKEFEE